MQPSVLQLFQVGAEDTFGSGAAGDANRRLKSFSLEMSYQVTEEDEEGQAFKSATGSIFGKESVDFDLTGKAAYADINYLLSSLLCSPVISTPTDAVLTRRWTYMPDMLGADEFDSLVIEKGIDGDVAVISGVRCNGLDLTFDPGKASVDMKGKLFGKKASEGESAFTSTPTLITPYTMSGKNVSVYISSSSTNWTGTKIKPLETRFSLPERHTRVFTLDDQEDSYEDTIEKGFAASANIIVPKGSVSNGYLDNMRDGTTKYCKIEAIGPLIETISGTPDKLFYNRLEITFPFNFRTPARQMQQDVHCAAFMLKAVYDATFGGTLKVVSDTRLVTL